MRRFFLICAVLFAGGVVAFGYTNVLENGTNQTITTAWDAAGDMTVGDTTSNNTLTIVSGGSLANVDAYVGAQAGASNNTVEVSGTGAEWINTGTLQVGATGNSNNVVSVSGGGTIAASSLVVFADNAFNLNADGHLDISGDFNAGQGGFNWTNDSLLSVGGSLTGMTELDGTDKSLIIDGGSWTTNSDLTIGLDGSGNSLTIQGGGVVSNVAANVGVNAGADSNMVMVTGANSVWANSGTLNIGSADTNAGNMVTVENSGTIAAAGLVIEADNEFNLNSGGTLAISGTFDVDQEGLFNWENDSTLEVGGILDGFTRLDGNGKTLVLDGGSIAIPSDTLEVGYAGSDNTLKALAGATIQSQNGWIGAAKGSHGNTVTITGTNSSWYVGNQLLVGVLGSGNELIIENHGLVTNASAWVGFGTNGNSVTVSGGGSEWLNGALFIGAVATNITTEDIGGETVVTTNIYTTSGNKVAVSNGGTVQAGTLAIQDGNDFDLDTGGTLRMTGAFKVSDYINTNFTNLNWDAGGNLSVGGALSGITNVTAGRILTLDGTNATWDLSGTDIEVGGDEESGSTMISTNGAIVSADNFYVEGSGNSANVESNAWLLVGDGADESALTEGGAMVASTSGALLSVDDSASVNIAETLRIGASATSIGTVAVTNGGTITAGDLVIEDANSAFNLENDGTLVMTGDFDAGQAGFNWKNGGTLTANQTLTFNDDFTKTNQTLNIDGGSWNRGADLQINGAGNTLSILSGGGVTNDDAYVIGSNNSVKVSGNGSDWLNNGALNITNSGNSVTVDSGGKVTADLLNITDGNNFHLNNDGTLRMTGVFDVSQYINSSFTNLNWDSGGNLSVGGELSGITNLNDGRILTLDGSGALWASAANTNMVVSGGSELQVTNSAIVMVGNLDVLNDNSLVNVESNAWLLVGDGADKSALTDGGLMVASTNGAWLSVDDSASVNIAETLKVGASDTATGTVTVANGGTITARSLDIFNDKSAFNLESGGTLAMTADFNVSDYINSSFTNLNWNDGGKLVMLDSDLSGISGLSGSNKTITIEGGSWSNETQLLSIDGVGNKLVVSSNSLVTSIGASIGTATNDNGNSVEVRGENAVWQNSGDLYVGDAGSGNSLMIEDGGFVNSTTGYIGFASTASNNTVTVGGSNSQWIVGADLFVGFSGTNNTLKVDDHGYVSVGNNLYVQNDGTLNLVTTNDTVYVENTMIISDSEITGKGTVQFSTNDVANVLSISGTNAVIGSDVVFDAGGGTDTVSVTDWEFKVTGNETNQYVGFENLTITNGILAGGGTLNAFDKIVVSGGWIAPRDEDLVIKGDFEVADNAILQVIAGEGSLRVMDAGGLNLTNMSAEVTVLGTNGFNEVILTADGGVTNDFANVEFVEHFLLYNFMLTNDATTVSVVSEAALDGEIGSALAYGGIQGIRAGFNGMQNAAFVRTKQLRRNTVATDHAISHEAYLMSNDDVPAGPKGPGDKNTIFGMHFWAEQFGGQGDYNAMGLSDGFTLNNNGTTFGLDRLFGDSLVAGINYTYARSAASATGGDRVDTETYWLGLYSEWFGKNDYYLEGLIGLGWSDYDTIRTDIGYEGVGTSEGTDFGGHIEAGKYFHHNNWAMVPYAGLHYLGIKSDAYTETEQASGTEIAVDGQSVASLESALGLKLRNRFDTQAGRFQTVGYAEWAYDFINDDIGSTLSDGTISVGTARITPGASLLNAGVGLSWICTDYLEIGIGYDGRFNENYEEHMGSAMLDVRF